jgi:hypothetical protein
MVGIGRRASAHQAGLRDTNLRWSLSRSRMVLADRGIDRVPCQLVPPRIDGPTLVTEF